MKRRTAVVADLFCGAGGTSTGAWKALLTRGIEMELVAVNHWPIAIETHSRNHPDARHYCVDLETAKPLELVPEGKLDLLMASPSCVHHSRARGGRPTNDQQRTDPWIIIRWLTDLRVKRLLIENVPEFMSWGPIDLRTGRPLKSKKGQYFQAWVKVIEALGFKLEYRVLCAANFGDATTRDRFFLMARSDGRKIVWPMQTHSKIPGVDMFGNVTLPWRTAREIIDWSITGNSIFDRKKPLAINTIRRIAAGIQKFGGEWVEPFLVMLNGGSHKGENGALSVDTPTPTVEPFVLGQHSGSVPRSVDEPIPTVTTDGAIAVIKPSITAVEGGGVLPKAFLVPQFGEAHGQQPRTHSIYEPTPTVTPHGAGALVEPYICSVAHGNADGDYERGMSLENRPLPMMAIQQGRMVEINGRYYLLDIRFRMLQNHELARAMGFSDEESQYEFSGSQVQITKQIGNAVPVNTAAALVAAIVAT